MTREGKLTVDRVSKSFGGRKVVDDCSFTVRSESITGLIGPNGAGKSTLFGLIAGSAKPDRGSVQFAGQPVHGMAPHRIAGLGIARTFQIPRELKQMSVLENVMLAGRAQIGERLDAVFLRRGRIRRDEGLLRSDAEAALHKVGLGEKASMKAGQLSGGQKKLLELARCLMSRPKLILLDEPTAGVNPSLIRDLVAVIRMLRAEGTTLLIIEHNMNVVTQLCEQVIVLDRGRVIAEGPPGEIQQNTEVIDAYLGHQRA